MSRTQLGMLFIIALTLVGVCADAVLKMASAERSFLQSKWLFVGIGLSCTFAIGWVFLMRVMKLATAGVMYGVCSALLLCLIGVVFFEERLSQTELAGVFAAMIAIVLLGTET